MIDQLTLQLFKQSKKVAILPHIMTDGDAIGSSCALQYGLSLLGKEASIIVEDDIPSNLKFLNIHNIIDFRNTETKSLDFDLLVTVDSSDLDRLGCRTILLDHTDNLLNIDHHKTNTRYGKNNIVDTNASACGEIVYRIIKALNIDINKDIATYLYVAITTDTGSFKYSNTTPTTLRIAADLLEAGIDKEYINIQLFQNKPLNKVKLLISTLNTLEFYSQNKISVMHVSREMLEENNINASDVDGLIEYGRDIKNVEVAILLKEIENNEYKIGLRSKGNCDVSKIAKLFGGGGHKNAAGCILYDTLNNSKQKLVELFIEEFKVIS